MSESAIDAGSGDTLDVIEAWTEHVTRVLAPNAGPMTLDGTNSYVIKKPGSYSTVIIDPGPRESAHLARLRSMGAPELILLTHRHGDHAEGAERLAHITGSVVRAVDGASCVGAPSLSDGEQILAAGTRIRVVATPGHTADSVCFHLPDDRDLDGHRRNGVMLTGDTILGRGTTIIAPRDGSLGDYFHSLRRLSGFAEVIALPGHGPRIGDLAATAARYLAHRRSKLIEVDRVVASLQSMSPDGDVSVAAVTDVVYAQTPPSLRFAAEANVRAQLDYLIRTAIEGFDPLSVEEN